MTTAGIALGVDRLMMLLTGMEDIREVQDGKQRNCGSTSVPVPMMRPRHD